MCWLGRQGAQPKILPVRTRAKPPGTPSGEPRLYTVTGHTDKRHRGSVPSSGAFAQAPEVMLSAVPFTKPSSKTGGQSRLAFAPLCGLSFDRVPRDRLICPTPIAPLPPSLAVGACVLLQRRDRLQRRLVVEWKRPLPPPQPRA